MWFLKKPPQIVQVGGVAGQRRFPAQADKLNLQGRLLPRIVSFLFLAVLLPLPLFAVDPPHTFTNNCNACHITHNSPGGALTTVGGNDNSCQSCHQSGGSASAKALPDTAEAVPWPGLPPGTNATGSSHRWDSGASGRIQFLGGAATSSTGTIESGGSYTAATEID